MIRASNIWQIHCLLVWFMFGNKCRPFMQCAYSAVVFILYIHFPLIQPCLIGIQVMQKTSRFMYIYIYYPADLLNIKKYPTWLLDTVLLALFTSTYTNICYNGQNMNPLHCCSLVTSLIFLVSFQSVMVMSLNELVSLFHNVLKHRSYVYLRLGVEENVYFYLDNILAFEVTSD